MIRIPTVALAVLVLAAAALTGCGGNSGQARNSATIKATAVVPVDVSKSKNELDQVVGCLKSLRDATEGEDMKKMYGDLKSRMSKLNDALDNVAESGDDAITAGNKQYTEWHDRANAFTDADLRNASTKREGNLRVAVDELAASNAAFKNTSTSYKAQQAQVLSALDLDLSFPGVQSIKPVITKLLIDEPDLRNALAHVSAKSQAVSAVSNP